MFEFTISCNENSVVTNYIYAQLKSVVDGLDGIIIKQNQHKLDNVCLAVSKKHADYIKAAILDVVSDCIISLYKQQHLQNSICINIKNQVAYNAFIKALVVFDRQTDKDIIKKNLVLEKKLNIDSYYNFKLEQLKNRWNDIAAIVNESIPIMLKDKSVIDITKYFIDSTQKEIQELHLLLNKSTITIKIDNEQSDLDFDTSKDYVSDVLTEIIAISPQKIVVHGDISKFAELGNALSSVFVDNIFVVNWIWFNKRLDKQKF